MGKNKATPADVHHAYRLLLGREPDEGGYAHYCTLIEAQALSPTELAWRFFDSAEFRARHGVLTKEDSGAAPEPGVVTLRSQACTQRQIESPSFRYWAICFREKPAVLHRKQWEWCFLTQALFERGMLAEGKRGLGFAVGNEPLSALYAKHGCRIVASDIGTDEAAKGGWTVTNASSVAQLNSRGICPDLKFAANVSFREVDMRAIDADLRGFDFVWSSCALEHLGGLAEGLRFVIESMECLVPGGIAVHTTELNCESDVDTVTSGHSVIYRRRDLIELAAELRRRGHIVEPLDFDLGDSEADRYVDEPPYNDHTHLKLRLGGYVSTSFGLIIRKGPV